MSYEINQMVTTVVPAICMIMLPIYIITQSGFKKSCLSAFTIYCGFLFLNYISN